MRPRRKITSLLLALIAVIIGLYAQSRIRQPNELNGSLALYALAAVIFVIAMRRTPEDQSAEPVAILSLSRTHRLTAGLFSLIALITCVAGLYLLNRDRPPAIAWGFYLISILSFLIGFFIAENRAPTWKGLLAHLRHPKWEQIALVVLLLVAFAIRFYRLGELPFGLWFDEADNGLWARMMNQDPRFQPVYVGGANLPWHFLVLLATSFRLLGEGVVALRLVSAVFGVLTVWATYLLVRDLFSIPMGFVAAIIMMVSHWNVNHSRIAMYGIFTPLFILAVAYFLNKGVRSQRRLDFALAGASLGLGLCFYVSYILFVGVVGVLFLHLIIAKRGFLRQYISHLIIFALAAFLAVAPVALFAARQPQVFFARTKTTSIFKDKTTEQALKALKETAVKHFLMFNYRGDGNGRHNLPGEPMLDYVTSVFFVLGIGYSLYRLRDPRYAFLIVGLLVMLSGGIFSLDFEAPQSLRAIGTLPISHLLAFVAIARLWQELDFVLGNSRSRYAFLLVAPMVAYICYTNLNIYFVKQANDFAVWNAHSTAESLTARRMAEMGADYDYRVISLYFQTPTLRFLAPKVTNYKRLETTDSVPIPEAGDKDVVFFIDPERKGIYDDVRRFYPQGKFEEIKPPFGGPTVLYIAHLTPAQVRGIQGLTANYYTNDAWDGNPAQTRKDGQISFDWSKGTPIPMPFSVEWQGTLRVPRYGNYRLGLRAPAAAQLYIDETPVLEQAGEAQLLLAEGNHALRLRAVGSQGTIDLYWQEPGKPSQIIPMGVLYTNPPVSNNGLLGRYFPNADWRGEPALTKVDPSLGLYFHITLLPRPYTVEWSGKINIPTQGNYVFGLESIDDSWLYIDDRLVVEAHVGNQYQQGAISLATGLHDIRVRYLDKSNWSHINVYWTPPGKQRTIIPAEYLLPPQGSYPKQIEAAKPAPSAPSQAQGDLELTPLATWGEPGTGEGQFKEPRDVAVDDKGRVYIADTGNRRVQVLDKDGGFLAQWTQGDKPFTEPLAVVVNAKGEILVLDSELGWIYRFSAEGEYMDKFGGPDAQMYHPRGMTLDDQDTVYVADTGGGRFILFDATGAKTGVYGSQGKGAGQFLEPTDIAINAWGDTYILDNSNQRIQHMDLFGRYQGEWAVPHAGAFNGAHIALAEDGTLFVTAPEAGLIQRYSADGALLGQWGQGMMRIPVNLVIKDKIIYVTDTMNHRIQLFQIQDGS
jgi:4-amino-4-deoxy-L-arabinose transferase-like glycosyltransferase/streptogramin lyase